MVEAPKLSIFYEDEYGTRRTIHLPSDCVTIVIPQHGRFPTIDVFVNSEGVCADTRNNDELFCHEFSEFCVDDEVLIDWLFDHEEQVS